MSEPDDDDPLLRNVRLRSQRRDRAQREGEPSTMKRLAEIGVLGWMIVVPVLVGLFIGRWLDDVTQLHLLFTTVLIIAGFVLGFWSAWRWMNRQ
jgi:ATP synthase protein I